MHTEMERLTTRLAEVERSHRRLGAAIGRSANGGRIEVKDSQGKVALVIDVDGVRTVE